jgi:hypothetical protein
VIDYELSMNGIDFHRLDFIMTARIIEAIALSELGPRPIDGDAMTRDITLGYVETKGQLWEREAERTFVPSPRTTVVLAGAMARELSTRHPFDKGPLAIDRPDRTNGIRRHSPRA